MEKVVDYTVVIANTDTELKDKVKRLIDIMNWQPFGGVSIALANNGPTVYAQALVMYSE